MTASLLFYRILGNVFGRRRNWKGRKTCNITSWAEEIPGDQKDERGGERAGLLRIGN